MSITGRPTAQTSISGTTSNLSNAYDNNMSTYAVVACTAAVQGRATWQGLSGTAQANSMVLHMQTYITSDLGTGCVLEFSYDGGTNWLTIYNDAGAADSGINDRSYSYNNTDSFDISNVRFRATAKWFTGDAAGDTSIRIYEAYVVYSGFFTAITDQAATTTTAYPVYSQNTFDNTTGNELAVLASPPATYDRTGTGPYTFYRLTGATENP